MAKSFSGLLAKMSPAAQAAVEKGKRELLRRHPLAYIRHSLGILQQTVADRLAVSQAAVSKLEARNDFILSTLASYATATGGELSVRLNYEGKSFELVRDDSLDCKGFVVRDVEIEPVYEAYSAGWQTVGTLSRKRPARARLMAANDRAFGTYANCVGA